MKYQALALMIFAASPVFAESSPLAVFVAEVPSPKGVVVEWLRPRQVQTIHDRDMFVLEIDPERQQATLGGASVDLTFLLDPRGVGLWSNGKDLLSARLVGWNPEAGGTLELHYRRQVMAYSQVYSEWYEVIRSAGGFELYGMREGVRTRIRALKLKFHYVLFASPGIHAIEPVWADSEPMSGGQDSLTSISAGLE